MKQKLKRYRSLFISILIMICIIMLYYIREFFLASVILIIYISLKEYLDINRELDNKKVDTLTTKIKANINDNISNMSYPIAVSYTHLTLPTKA